jgi:hypothetical protein
VVVLLSLVDLIKLNPFLGCSCILVLDLFSFKETPEKICVKSFVLFFIVVVFEFVVFLIKLKFLLF